MVQPLWRIVWTVLKRLHRELPYDPVTPLVHIYLGKNIILFVALFIFAALFITVKTWMQSQRPLTDVWIKKMWCIYICTYTHIYVNTHTHMLLLSRFSRVRLCATP